MKKVQLLLVLPLAVLTPLSACSKNSDSKDKIAVTGLEMREGYDSINIKDELNLEAKVQPSNATDQKINFTLSNPEVVSVSETGLVTPKTAGHTTITASTNDGGFSKSFTVDVIDYDTVLIGNTNGKASESFIKINETFKIAKYSEDDISFVQYPGVTGDWYIEANVSDLDNNITSTDIYNTSGYTLPTGVAAIGNGNIYSFGPISYQRATYNSTYYDNNFYDATMSTFDGTSRIDSIKYKANFGGEGSYFINATSNYKVATMKSNGVFYYFVNDILIGMSSNGVSSLNNASPAICTYKSGAIFSDVKIILGESLNIIQDKLTSAFDKQYSEKMFENPYTTSTTSSVNTYTNAIDLSGDLYISDNSKDVILPTKYDGQKFYLEATFNLSSHSDNLSSLDSRKEIGGGVGSLALDGSRRMVMGPSNNRSRPTSSSNYIENSTEEGQYRELNLTVSKHRGLVLDDNHFKAAVLRDNDICYYFLNDILVFQDTNKRTWELNTKWTCFPILASVSGGAGKLENITLLTDETEVDNKYQSLNVWQKEKELPKKVKVIILSGQSNCEGVTRIKDLTDEQLEEYDRPYNNVAISYYSYSYTHMSRGKFVEVGFGQGLDESYFGFEVGLAHELSIIDPNTYYCLIKAARGDSDIEYHYRSPSMGGEVGPIYTATVDYINRSLQTLKDLGVDFEIAGLCWMQGERDGSHVVMTHNYKENFKNLYNDWSKEWNQYCGDKGLMLYDALIKNYQGTFQYCDLINQTKRELAAENSSRHFIIDTTSSGLDLKTLDYDWCHFDAPSELKLGKAFADAIVSHK